MRLWTGCEKPTDIGLWITSTSTSLTSRKWRPRYGKGRNWTRLAGGIACSDGANVIGFLDVTLRRNCRPGGPPEVQQELFDGHHRSHGLLYQCVVFPNGMIGDLYGPAVGRRHDAFLL